jgi:pimeloyl-ACP methyl ester carboxylesterase
MSVVSVTASGRRAAQIETRGVWFGSWERPAMGWLTRDARRATGAGVVIAPPTGYAYCCSHRALRDMAERLAARGHTVLRIDYDGAGDSAGDQWDGGRVAAWRDTVALAAGELRRLGVTQLTLVGARLGGTIALLDARGLSVDRVVAWMPVPKGRQYAKEVRLLSEPVPEALDPLRPAGTCAIAGSVFSVETLADLERLSVMSLEAPPAAATLVFDHEHGSATHMVEHLRSLGTCVEHVMLDASEDVLETPPEYAVNSNDIVARACEWIGDADSGDGEPPPIALSSSATLLWRGRRVREEVLRLEPVGHVAVLTSPEHVDPELATLVLLNPGSESHVGPGRAWVEYARDIALTGRRAVRVDFLGWGESPNAVRAPGRPYDAVCVQDTAAIVHELRRAGHRRIAICGLCASAWVALEAARGASVEGVVAINPQLYWKPGDPVEIDWSVIRARRSAEIRRIELGARLRIWSLLDAAGIRNRAARWLDEVIASGTRVELVFAEDDDGLVYLSRRLGRHLDRLRIRRAIGVQELEEVDHPMHRAWLRSRVTDALARALDEIDSRR